MLIASGVKGLKVSDICTKLVSKKGKKGLNRNLEFDCINLYKSFDKIH